MGNIGVLQYKAHSPACLSHLAHLACCLNERFRLLQAIETSEHLQLLVQLLVNIGGSDVPKVMHSVPTPSRLPAFESNDGDNMPLAGCRHALPLFVFREYVPKELSSIARSLMCY